MKYKSDFKKYCKSEFEQYKNISIKILRSERADLPKSTNKYQQVAKSTKVPDSHVNQKVPKHPFIPNIARGTTDPGYRVYNLNYLFDWIEFVFIQAAEMTQVLNSIPWVRCASGNVW